MLERKRKSKHYNLVVGDDDGALELGEGIGVNEGQETGITGSTLEHEVDNWDENAEDWKEDEPTATEEDGPTTLDAAHDVLEEGTKRSD